KASWTAEVRQAGRRRDGKLDVGGMASWTAEGRQCSHPDCRQFMTCVIDENSRYWGRRAHLKVVPRVPTVAAARVVIWGGRQGV
ncbi:hypothetical protein BGX38DRAFT_1227435, partial [Terfezia claveryi]